MAVCPAPIPFPGERGEGIRVPKASASSVAALAVPEGRDVAGVGRGTLYVTREDDDGLLWLELYRR